MAESTRKTRKRTTKAEQAEQSPQSIVVKLTLKPDFMEHVNVWGVENYGRLWTRLPTTERLMVLMEAGLGLPGLE